MLMRVTVLVAALAVGPLCGLHAQGLEDYDYENLAFRGIGLAVGPVWPTKVDGAVQYTARADLGFLGPGVRIAPSLSYWTSELEEAELVRLADKLNELGASLDPATLRPIDWTNVNLTLDGHYMWRVPANFFTYVGVGLGVHVLDGAGNAIDGTFVEDLLDSVTAGVSGVAGLEYAATDRFRLFGEARFTALDDVQYPSLSFGGAVMFPRTEDRPAAADGR